MKQNKPLFIGVTGGAGCGKSKACRLLEEYFGAEILEADRIARELCSPGGVCLPLIQEAFPDPGLYESDGSMNRKAFADLVFREELKRNQLNRIVYPEVKRYIISRLEKKREQEGSGLFVLESAQLLEDGYDRICDELWYVYAPESVRRQRLLERGYSMERIEGLFRAQPSEEEFARRCTATLDNSGSIDELLRHLKTLVGNG